MIDIAKIEKSAADERYPMVLLDKREARALCAVVRAAEDAGFALSDLLDDTQHKDHNCGEGPCPVRHAEKSLAALREALKEVSP